MMECKEGAGRDQRRPRGRRRADAQAGPRQGRQEGRPRVAAEGVVAIESLGGRSFAAMVEINCETDFVAREADFQGFAADVARKTLETRATDVAALNAVKLASGETVDERRRALVAKIGENISVRRFERSWNRRASSARIATARRSACWSRSKAAMRARARPRMHVAAINPQYLSVADVPPSRLAKEREIETEKAKGGQAGRDRRQDGRGPPPQVAGRGVAARPGRSSRTTRPVEKLLKAAGAKVALPALRGRAPASRRSRRLRRRGDGPGAAEPAAK